MVASRTQPASVKIVCLGLGRTGTTSLLAAMEILGLGPCYHMSTILRGEGESFIPWGDIGDENSSPEAFDKLFREYRVLMDYPVAMYPRELYAAYPNAKFILTTRDPAMWEKSMNSTILKIPEVLGPKTVKSTFDTRVLEWLEKYMLGKYHRGRLYTHAQEEIVDHDQRIKAIIPPEQLLVFDVREGWDKLVEFLGVSKPECPFPHVNDTKEFQDGFLRGLSS